jgi:ATP-dependent RNA helicase HelY
VSEEPFVLDRFQREAIAAIDHDLNVLVAAPTGAGKTVVANHAVRRSMAQARRAFYTTPIKALSNQKYADLVREHGRDQVGLLTGDNAVNPHAPVVVMTTEVLRNMIYVDSPALSSLGWVVLDEVHFLQDPYRGPVWEEVIVHSPPDVRFVCLSATVSNAEELAGWLDAVRGHTATVVEHERPVELVNHYLVHDREHRRLVQLETLVGGRPNPQGERFDGAAPSGPARERYRQRSRQPWSTPRRNEVVEHLAGAALLPAIYFIFSRRGCDDAAGALVDQGVSLTTAGERRRIREVVAQRVGHLPPGDLAALDHERWRRALECGVAAHHAGMVPPFKEAVEACFVEGLIKVVFATETLALGINMPARSVVIESLSKFTGEHHEDLTPSQYTQLTGRAGRRGLDPVGHALVLWSPWHGFDKVAALAASREFVLRSAFAPTYNMVVNLIRRYDRDRAHELLGRSFAQFQADRSLARLLSRRAGRQRLLADAEAAARCELGDVDEYRRLRTAERQVARQAREGAHLAIREAAEALVPGDVIAIGRQPMAVLSVSHRNATLRLRLVDAQAKVVVVADEELREVPDKVGTVAMPSPYDPQARPYQRRVANALRKVRPSERREEGGRAARRRVSPATAAAGEHSRAHDHPVASCPDRARHLEAIADRDRLVRQLEELDRRAEERSGSLVKQFDRIETILSQRGFVDGWALTQRGEVLARIFHESDLLAATAVADGLFDDLDAPSMAGLASLITYEHRSKTPPAPPWYPSAKVRERATAIEMTARELARAEEKARLSPTRAPDPTFCALAYAWAAGEDFDVVMAEEDLSGGDFVRNVKQLIDLLRQIGEVAPVPATAATARQAADRLLRGIVAVSSEPPGSADPDGAPDGEDG